MEKTMANRQLFVGNLPFTFGWQDLKDLFRECGNVLRADVAVGMDGRSRGFGTVLYERDKEAAEAIAKYHNFDIKGRIIEVRLDKAVSDVHANGIKKEPTPVDLSKIQGNALYVGNLPFSIGWQELKDLFKEAGYVQRAEIAMMPNSQSKSRGFGTIVMSNVDEARRAAELFHGKVWNGRRIEVREDRDAREFSSHRVSHHVSKTSHGGSVAGKKLYIGNIPYNFHWQEIKDMLRPYGTVVRADVALDDQSRSKGYAEVIMSSPEEVRAAIEGLDEALVEGRTIEVREDKYAADQKHSTAPSTQIFLGNLPFSTKWQELKDMIKSFNLIPTHVDVVCDVQGRSRGFAIARFASEEEALEAVQRLSECDFEGRTLTCKLDKYNV